MNPLNSNFSTEIDFIDITELFTKTSVNERCVLTEMEVYKLLEYTGAVLSPVNEISDHAGEVSDEQLAHFKGDKVLLKIVSRSITHKTDAGGVKIIPNQNSEIRTSIKTMLKDVPFTFEQFLLENPGFDLPESYKGLTGKKLRNAIAVDIDGVLIVEFIAPESTSFGSELLVGLRNTREFGITISAGLGGSNTELFADNFVNNMAVTSASSELHDGDSFFKLFKKGLAYNTISGQSRGQERLVSDDLLISCFDAMINLASFYSPCNPDAPFVIEELEINPFAFAKGRIIPLDGYCRFAKPSRCLNPRPIHKIDKLLHPSSIGIVGVSANKMNFGRIILSNLIASGYEKSKMSILRSGIDEIDGVKCIEDLSSLEEKLDLLIVAVGADAVFILVEELILSKKVESVMLIPGGLGETEASRKPAARMSALINNAHSGADGGPIFLGGNCLGIVSHPGGYDSWFIPKEKLPRPQKKQRRSSAFISQSGAFMITRLSQIPWIDPAYMAALGNQNDLTHGDMISYFAENPKVDIIGIYAEGFNDLDGLNCAKAVRAAVLKGKQVIVYKAGRSKAGRNAAMGHTASIAGDHKICEELLQQAGAITCSSISEFNDVFYLANLMHDKKIAGNRLAAVSGAGFETVGMADSVKVDGYSLQIANFKPETNKRLKEILASKRLDALMEVRNPFDINPGADDEAHLLCTAALCEDPGVDAVVVGLDPLSPMMRTLESSLRAGFDINSEDSIATQMPKMVAAQEKPIIGVMDGGELYTPVINKLRDNGVVVFRSCDRAIAALNKYTQGRLQAERIIITNRVS